MDGGTASCRDLCFWPLWVYALCVVYMQAFALQFAFVSDSIKHRMTSCVSTLFVLANLVGHCAALSWHEPLLSGIKVRSHCIVGGLVFAWFIPGNASRRRSNFESCYCRSARGFHVTR